MTLKYWCQVRQINQHNGIQSLETNSHIYTHLIYDKGDTSEQWEIVFSINFAVSTGYPQGEKKTTLAPISPHIFLK